MASTRRAPPTPPGSRGRIRPGRRRRSPPQKGQALGQFVSFLACGGQEKMATLGYSPLPPVLVQEDFNAIGRMNGGQQPPPVSAANCKNPYVDGEIPLPGSPRWSQGVTGSSEASGAATRRRRPGPARAELRLRVWFVLGSGSAGRAARAGSSAAAARERAAGLTPEAGGRGLHGGERPGRAQARSSAVRTSSSGPTPCVSADHAVAQPPDSPCTPGGRCSSSG